MRSHARYESAGRVTSYGGGSLERCLVRELLRLQQLPKLKLVLLCPQEEVDSTVHV